MKIHEGQGSLLPPHRKTGPKKGSDAQDFKTIMDQANTLPEQKEGATGKAVPSSIPGGVQIIQGQGGFGRFIDIKTRDGIGRNGRVLLRAVDFELSADGCREAAFGKSHSQFGIFRAGAGA